MQLVRIRLIEDKNLGCEEAPVEILKELRNVKNISLDKIHLEEIHVDLDDKEESNHLIFDNSKEIFEMSEKSFFVGGDKSINFSLIRAFDKIFEKNLLIIFDAHTNCGNGEWIRKLVDNGFNGKNIILIGCRNISLEELEFIKKEKINLIKMEIIDDIEEICDMIMERANNSNSFFVCLNLNVVDPAFVPGVCDFESGGFSSNDLLYFARRLRILKSFKGTSFFGINPKKDFNGISVNFCARLIGEFINNYEKI